MLNPSTLSAKIISYLFHPLLLPTAGLFLIFNLGDAGLWFPSPEAQLVLYSITLLATFFLPVFCILLLIKMKQISSLEMNTKEERKLPYLISVLFYFSQSYFMHYYMDVPVLVKAWMLGATIIIVSILIINVFWKISAHMAAMGGLCGMMIAISFRLQIDLHYILIALFLIAGLVAFARLKLNAHDPAQVYAGFLLGVTVQLVLFL